MAKITGARNYSEAKEALGNRDKRKVGNHTYLVRNFHTDVPADAINLQYHQTFIATFFADGRIKVNSGGYHTITTKQRINVAIAESGWSLYQQNFEWFLDRFDGTKPRVQFEDGLMIHPDGRVTLA